MQHENTLENREVALARIRNLRDKLWDAEAEFTRISRPHLPSGLDQQITVANLQGDFGGAFFSKFNKTSPAKASAKAHSSKRTRNPKGISRQERLANEIPD